MKGVEDGIADEHKITHSRDMGISRADCSCGWFFESNNAPRTLDASDDHLESKLPAIRSATPEELTAQAESYGKNYKPGPRQATPFMPQPEVDGDWPARCLQRAFVEGMKWWQFHNNGSTAFGSEVDKAETEALRRYGVPLDPPTLPVPERTAEMEELRERMRQAVEKLEEALLEYNDTKEINAAIALLTVDHIEGKPKLSIQEVKE